MTELPTIFEKTDSHFPFSTYEFNAGIQELNDFFYKYALTFIKYGYTQMYILRESEQKIIIGYFTVSSSTIQWEESLNLEKITRYVPGILI